MYSFFKTIIGILVCAICGYLHAQTKIAVIADKGLENYADLLTVELSKQKGLNVVERTDIDRVLREQEISNINLTANYLRLGKLLKADGMVIIKKFESQKKDFLVSRLVAVNQGAVLSAFASPLPPEKIENWPTDVSAKFAPYLNKVGVSQDKAVPISILNIRAPIDTPEMRLLEKEFTLALAFRLVQEKDLFVLERWKMEKLSWEKDIDTESSPFWTGSYFLDGSIEITGKENVKVRVRLRKKDGAEKIIEATGNRQEIAGIVEKLTEDLLKQIGKTENKIPWDSKKEAEQYLKEARWALSSGLYAEALSAVDSAWALGSKSQDALLMKINAYSCLSYPNNESTGDIYWRPDLIGLQMNKESLDYAISAMRLLDDYLLPAIPLNKLKHEDENKWRKVAEISILNSSLVLLSYYKQGSLENDMGKIRMLRSLIKEAYPEIVKRVSYVYPQIFQMKAYFLPMWCDTPEETFDECRKLINEKYPDSPNRKNELFQMVLEELLARTCFKLNNPLPPLIDWSGELKKDTIEYQWQAFVDKLAASENIKEKYFGLYLKTCSYEIAKGKGENKYLLELMKMSLDEREKLIDDKSDIPAFSGRFGGDYNNFLSDDSKAQLSEYLFRYVKSWLEISIGRKTDIITISRNFDLLYGMWFDLCPSMEQAKIINGLLLKAKSEISVLHSPNEINHYLELSLRKYPEAMVAKENALIVSKYWLPILVAENKPLRNHRIGCFVGLGDKVAIFSFSCTGSGEGKLYIMDPIDLTMKEIEIKDQEKAKVYSLCDINDKYALIIGDNKRLLKYHFDSGKWQSFDIIEKNYDSISVSGERALLTFKAKDEGKSDSGIIIFDLHSGVSEMIASSRRNPPQSPLDNIQSYKVHNIMEVLPGIFSFDIIMDCSLSYYFYAYDTKTRIWAPLLSLGDDMLGKIFKRKISFKDRSFRSDLFLVHNDSFQKSTSYNFGNSKDITVKLPLIEEWEIPEAYLCVRSWVQLNNIRPYVTYDGRRAFYYAESSRNPGSKYLIAFNENEKNGYEIPLDFRLSDKQKEMLFGENNKLSNPELWYLAPAPSRSKIVWKEGCGLFINDDNSAFLWFIPHKDIDDYMKTITAGSNPEQK